MVLPKMINWSYRNPLIVQDVVNFNTVIPAANSSVNFIRMYRHRVDRTPKNNHCQTKC